MTERMPAWLDGTGDDRPTLPDRRAVSPRSSLPDPPPTLPDRRSTLPDPPPTDRWPTLPAGPPVSSDQPRDQPYVRGVAAVPPSAPTTGASDAGEIPAVGTGPRQRTAPVPPTGMVVRRRWRQLRSGGEWTTTGLLFALVCWGIWVMSERGGDLSSPVLTLAMVLLTAAFVFAMSRMVGRTLLERVLGRRRRSAWPSHLAAGLFLAASGIMFLRQTRWIIGAWNWLTEHLSI